MLWMPLICDSLGMARIGNMVICESTQQVENANGKKTTLLVNPAMEIRLPVVPCLYSFSVSFCVGSLEQDERIEQVKGAINDPDGNVLSIIELTEMPPRLSQIENYVFCFDFRNTLFKEEGLYTVEINVNGKIFQERFGIKRELEIK